MKKNLLAILLSLFVANAQGAILLEPYLGVDLNGDAGDSGDYSGTTMGARVGWQTLGLFLAFDYRMSTFDVDDFDKDLDQKLYSAVIGYDFPILVRAYAQFVMGGNAEVDYGSAGKLKLKEPSGTILGVGFTGLPFVSLNFEMANYEYDKFEFPGGSGSGADFKHYTLSVSLPLTF